ncbi:hypothetical protein ACX80E_08135 [Arthrobacter sp. TMN-49]
MVDITVPVRMILRDMRLSESDVSVGRLLESPWAIMIILLVLVGIILAVVMAGRGSRAKVLLPAGQFSAGVSGASPNDMQGAIYQDFLLRTGRSHRSSAFAMGIIGLFVFGIILGPLAISAAGKAEAHGVPAPGGKILGVIDTIFGIVWLFVIFRSM